jgi:23S rRNA G2445 N2-methylase RlmL
MSRIFAVTTRGLEAVSADELGSLPGVTLEQMVYRRVFATSLGSLTPLLSLRTVDDIFIYLDTWQGIERARQTLSVISYFSSQLDLGNALEVIREIRSIPSLPTFSVTANFVGKRNYNTDEIKQACSSGIVEAHGWLYSEDDSSSDLNIRIFIEGDTAVVGLRLAERSLSKRAYKQEHVPGSLKPTVAGALLSLAKVTSNTRILDPCCGAGTILIEAKSYSAIAWGGDINQQTVASARINASQAGADVNLQQWDARALPLSDRSVDCVISNLPWGRAVTTDGSLQTLYQGICEEIERVLTTDGKVVLLTNLPGLVQFKRLKRDNQLEISLFGQTPTITVWSDRI